MDTGLYLKSSPPLTWYHGWEKEHLYKDGDLYFSNLIQDIRNAKQIIKIEAYIFDNDELGSLLVEELLKAFKRGVKVKILVDGIGSHNFIATRGNELKNKGISFRIFNPLPWQVKLHISTPIQWSFLALRSLYWINKRNHRKAYIIDDKIAYVGSLNISALHTSKFHRDSAWRDTGIKLMGSQLNDIINAFQKAWDSHLTHAPYKHIKKKISIFNLRYNLVRLNDCPRWREYFNRELIYRIKRSQNKVWITNPYFVPNAKLCRTLIGAAKRGVDIKIIVPQKSDMKFFPLINSISYRQLTKHGIKVYEYCPTVLHAKTIIIDNWCQLGSSNLNFRSRYHDLELDIVATKDDTKKQLTSHFLEDLSQSKRVTCHDIMLKYGRLRFYNPFIKLIKYWL